MQDEVIGTPTIPKRVPWNKGKLTGAKPPLRPKHVWSIRTKLQIEGRVRDLAMFNLAIDSKLRGCDVVAIRVANGAEKEALLASSPEKYFTEPHYNGFPAVLVRLAAVDPDELAELITDAWLCQAPRALVRNFDPSAHRHRRTS